VLVPEVLLSVTEKFPVLIPELLIVEDVLMKVVAVVSVVATVVGSKTLFLILINVSFKFIRELFFSRIFSFK
jgi:hypothetical protein